MSKRDEKNVDEERVYDALKKMQMKPSDEFKERTFQMMQKEVELARKNVKRKGKQIMKKSLIISLSGIAAAIAFVLLLNMNNIKEGVTPDRQPGENQPDAVQEPDIEKEEPKEPTEQKKESNRPETKEIVIYPEGMEEVRTYKLLDAPSLPFTTYIPENFIAEPLKTAYFKGIRVLPKDLPNNKINVVFYHEGTTEVEAYGKLQEFISDSYKPEKLLRDNGHQLPDWVLESYLFHAEPYGSVTLGIKNDQYFIIQSQFSVESGDGWGWVEKVFIDEWEWRDTGLPLNK